MNGIVLVQGMLNGGEEGARSLLHDFWRGISEQGKHMSAPGFASLDQLLEPYLKASASALVFNSIANLFSPYQFNPFNYHPIENVLKNMIDIEQIRKSDKLKLFVCARFHLILP